jgi:phthalate 4,5-dioxygenase
MEGRVALEVLLDVAEDFQLIDPDPGHLDYLPSYINHGPTSLPLRIRAARAGTMPAKELFRLTRTKGGQLMLTHDEVETFCRVGQGTPAGEVFRRYWTPMLPASDLSDPGGPPVPFKVLGEDLVAFRTKDGIVGVLDRYCSHRGASLGIAAVDDCGLRCIYHGWLFATDGRIVETPNMPATSKFKDINRQGSYPVREAGGIIWAYLGPPEKEPLFPEYFWFHENPEDVSITDFTMGCNYLQVQEGSIDSSHLSILHMGMNMKRAEPEAAIAASNGIVPFEGWPGETMKPGSYIDNIPSEDMAPRFEVQGTDFGFQYAAIRDSIYGPDRLYVRITTVIFPYMAYIPPKNTAVITVPLDDYTTAFMGVHVAQSDPEARPAPGAVQRGPKARTGSTRAERHVEMPVQDRQAMAEGRSFSGYAGGRLEDIAVQVSMGPMFDRHNEHLVSPADAGIVRYRHLLRDEIRRVAEGKDARFTAPSIDTAKVEAGSGILPPGVPWAELVPGNRVVQDLE